MAEEERWNRRESGKGGKNMKERRRTEVSKGRDRKKQIKREGGTKEKKEEEE